MKLSFRTVRATFTAYGSRSRSPSLFCLCYNLLAAPIDGILIVSILRSLRSNYKNMAHTLPLFHVGAVVALYITPFFMRKCYHTEGVVFAER